MSGLMLQLRQIEQEILASGKVDGHHLEVLRSRVYAGNEIERRAADFLVGLHKRVQHLTPAFEHFYYQALKDYILVDGRIDAEDTAWLKQLLSTDGTIDDKERKFLHEIKGEAKHSSPEFEVLFGESMKQPPEQHTCG